MIGLVSRLHQLFCRHEFMAHNTKNSMALECSKCLYVTPGWELKPIATS
jgi:hypothetical protein